MSTTSTFFELRVSLSCYVSCLSSNSAIQSLSTSRCARFCVSCAFPVLRRWCANCYCYFPFSLNLRSLSSACLSKMCIFLTRVTPTGWNFFRLFLLFLVCVVSLCDFMCTCMLFNWFWFSFRRLPNGHVNFEVDDPLYWFVYLNFVVFICSWLLTHHILLLICLVEILAAVKVDNRFCRMEGSSCKFGSSMSFYVSLSLFCAVHPCPW